MEQQTYQTMSELEDYHWWFIARRKIIQRLIACTGNHANMRLLEVGSGTGGNSTMLKQFGELDSLEKSATAIQLAEHKNPDVKYLACDVPDELDCVTDETYDLIVMLDVLEHIEDDQAALMAVKKKLKPGGTMIVSTPAHPFLWSQHDVIHHHYRRYQKDNLLSMVELAGMKVEYHTYINCFLAPIVFSIRCFNRVFRRQHQNDEKRHNPVTNKILEKIFAFESKLIPRFRLPFGISHLILIKNDR